MSKWLEKTDIKQLMVYMFGVIVALMMALYTKDISGLNDKLSDIAEDIKTIKMEQKKESGKFNAKIEKEVFVIDSRHNALRDRVRVNENHLSVIRGEVR